MDSPTFFLSLVIVAIIVFLIVSMYPRMPPNTGGQDTTDNTATIFTYPTYNSYPFYTLPYGSYYGGFRPWYNRRRWVR